MKLLALLLAIGLILFLALEAWVLLGSREDTPRQEADVILVLGCKIWGEEPSPALQARLDRALDYRAQLLAAGSKAPLLVVSGGKGADEPITEARAMADYLMAQGVPGEEILLEEASHSTDTNLAFSLALLEEQGVRWRYMAIVSNNFHLARVRMLAGRYGIDCAALGGEMPTFSSRLWSTLREGPAFVKSWLLDGREP